VFYLFNFLGFLNHHLVSVVSRFGLVEDNGIVVVHHYGVHLSSSILMYNFKSFLGKL
jgi:hypothetical protein